MRCAHTCRAGPGSGHLERGSGTVLVLGLVAGALVLAAAATVLGSAVAARHRAAVAADLSALAAADVLLGRAGGDPCGRAREVAGAHGGRLAECAIGGDETVTVAVGVVPRGPARALGTAMARARAGPGP